MSPEPAVSEKLERAKISAFLVTYNEEDHIAECLETLSFCDEIIVIDSHSTDRTREIAASFGARVMERDWNGFIDQKSFGLSQCSYEWTLNLDADERVSAELRESILGVLQDPSPAPVAGFECNRVVYFLDRWWRRGGWFPEYRLRFFRKSQVVWGGTDPHEKAIPQGPIGRLKGELEHFSFDDLDDLLRRLDKYSFLSAKEYFRNGGRAGVKEIVLSPIMRFLKFYALKQGFREGLAGFIVASNEAFYTFMKYARVWEMQEEERRRKISG